MRDYLLTSTDDRRRQGPGANLETLPMSHIQFNILDTVRGNDTVSHSGVNEIHIGSESQRLEPHRDEGTSENDINKVNTTAVNFELSNPDDLRFKISIV